MTEQNRFTESGLHRRIPELAKVHYFEELESTNDLGKKIAKSTDEVPALIYADRQTRGRGRGSKSWISDNGSMTFSFLIDDIHPLKIPRFSLTWGMAIARTLNQLSGLPLCFQVKWPNDVISQGRKVAGVLIESVADHPKRLIVGIGINVTNESHELAHRAQDKMQPISVVEATGESVDKAEILVNLWRNFQSIERLQNDRWLEDYQSLDFLTGKKIVLLKGNHETQGVYCGVTPEGALVLQEQGRMLEFHSGSVMRTS